MRKTINQLTLIYYGLYVLAIAFAATGYSWFSGKEALIAEQSTSGTVITSIYILFLILSIPLSLKLFNTKVKKLSALRDEEEKINKYKTFSIWRLLIIGSNLLVGIILFYLLNSRSMIFCAGIAAIALVFCKPAEMKMASDLHIDE